jgi:murein DD-endopeptidase MepM/ murein hydrolase activator NlpD
MKNILCIIAFAAATNMICTNARAQVRSLFEAASKNEGILKTPTNAGLLTNPDTGRGYFASLEPKPKTPELTAEKPSDEEMGSTGQDEPDPMDDSESEVFGGPTFAPGEVKGDVERCKQYAPLFSSLIKKYAKPDTKITVATVCGVWKREGVPNMCLGATRGEPCNVSSAKAKGPFQCLDSTGRAMVKDRPYNPQSLEDSAECGIRYLSILEKQVGEQNMFYAYQSGPAGDFSRPNPQIYNRTVRKFISVFEGAGDLTVGADGRPLLTTLMGVAPMAPGTGYICSVVGEFRASHPTVPHQGQDWCGPAGTAVYAPVDAIIVRAGWTGTASGNLCGGQVAFSTGDGTIGSLAEIQFCHLGAVTVKAGDRVKAGQLVGYLGDKGDGKSGIKNSAPHLHWETKVATSRTVRGGKTYVKSIAYPIMGRWFDFSPFIAGTATQNPRYVGPKAAINQKKIKSFWH